MRRSVLVVLVLGACWSKPDRVPDDGIDAPVQLVAGRKHACAITGGQLRCWGKNDHGQLGDQSNERNGTPQPIDGIERVWTWIAAGDTHTCGITDVNELYCWGDDSNGQVAEQGATRVLPRRIALPDDATPAKIYAGYAATCAIDDVGRLYCWGTYDIDRVAHHAPTHVMPGNHDGPWRSVAIGDQHVCALDDVNNRAYCWGKNQFGELGVGDDHALDGAQPKPDREFVALAAGHQATCGITVDRKLVCFGNPELGLIGPAPDAARHQDYEVDSTHRWTAVAMGRYHTCAIGDEGARCFGTDDRGALGSFEPRRELPEEALSPAIHLIAGESFSCALTPDGVVCWGSNSDGELGNGEIATAYDAVALALPDVQLVSTGTGHTCAVANPPSGREIYCWGDNRMGQVTPGGPAFIYTPTLLPLSSSLQLDFVAAGGEHTCARDSNRPQEVHCWGSNLSHQYGNDTGLLKLSEVPAITGGSFWVNLVASDQTTCGVDDASNLACWGELPGTAQASLPTAATGKYQAPLALGSDVLVAQTLSSGDVVTFGTAPATGCATDGGYPVPASVVPGATTSDDVDLAQAKGGHHGCRLLKLSTSAEVVCWGQNDAGQTGVAPSVCSAPQVVPPPPPRKWSNATSTGIAAGGSHTCAIADDLHLWCWGQPDRGAIGNVGQSSEVPSQKVTGLWNLIASGPSHMCGLSNAAMPVASCWGENRFGEVGNGLHFHPEPVAVVGL